MSAPPLGMVPFLPTHAHRAEEPCELPCAHLQWSEHVERYGNPYEKLAEVERAGVDELREAVEVSVRAAVLREAVEALNVAAQRWPAMGYDRAARHLQESFAELALERRARELEEKIRTCHERIECPECGAPVGERCRAMPIGWSSNGDAGRLLKGPHERRWTQEVPKR